MKGLKFCFIVCVVNPQMFNECTFHWANLCITILYDALPTESLKDSNVNPKQKTTEGQGVGARSAIRSTLEG